MSLAYENAAKGQGAQGIYRVNGKKCNADCRSAKNAYVLSGFIDESAMKEAFY
jgi:hypothetical protein